MVVRGSARRTLRPPSRHPGFTGKRSRQEAPSSFRVKRARTKKHKKSRVKTGSYAGLLIASKPVTVTKRGVRIRERYAATGGVISDTRRLWTGANTIGDEQFLFSLIAEAMMENILRSIKDTRSDKDKLTDVGFLSKIKMTFQRDALQFGVAVPARTLEYDITGQSNSFNGMVYNNVFGAAHNISIVDGVTTTDILGLRDHLFDFATAGFYPEKMFLYRLDTGLATHEILRDTQFGRANIKVSISGLHKFQNVTPADNVDAAQYNANAIDANPLSGKIYTFRNLAPRFDAGWLTSQGAASITTLENMSGRPFNRNHWDYKQISDVTDSAAGIGMPSINEFKLPVLRTRAVFANAKTSTNISIPPGGFKVYKTRFSYDGSIVRLIRDVTQVTVRLSDTVNNGHKYPTLGDSFVLCLTPSMKTGGADDNVTLGFDFTKDGQAFMSRYTAGTMPTTNVVE